VQRVDKACRAVELVLSSHVERKPDASRTVEGAETTRCVAARGVNDNSHGRSVHGRIRRVSFPMVCVLAHYLVRRGARGVSQFVGNCMVVRHRSRRRGLRRMSLARCGVRDRARHEIMLKNLSRSFGDSATIAQRNLSSEPSGNCREGT
jgi:hypothetical protein